LLTFITCNITMHHAFQKASCAAGPYYSNRKPDMKFKVPICHSRACDMIDI